MHIALYSQSTYESVLSFIRNKLEADGLPFSDSDVLIGFYCRVRQEVTGERGEDMQQRTTGRYRTPEDCGED
jgi:hypothetical protein